jgi:voltage-gated potassium channel
VLLGRYPNAEMDIAGILPTLPPPPSAGIPSEILERRPDIVSAERQIASAFDATDQARAARLPRFSLTSTVSGASDSLSDILDPANVVWQPAGNLIAPLFDGGRRQIHLFLWSIYLVAPLLTLLGILIILLGQIVCSIEKWRKFDGLYWSFITATTVGYGDIRPLRKLSKILSVVIALVGLMFTGIVIAVTLSTATVALEKHGDKQVIEAMKEKFK